MTGRICRLLHSPVERCLQTAEQLRAGQWFKIRSSRMDGITVRCLCD